jgi:Na+-transporting methylmalonyl-CoA/oxaloacetate decarboxylase beta subunit
VAVVIKSDKAEGVISDLFMVIMVAPYANDTYLDMIGSIKIGDILSDSKVIDSLLPTMTERLLNSLFKLESQIPAKAKTSKKGVVDKVKSTGSTGVAA